MISRNQESVKQALKFIEQMGGKSIGKAYSMNFNNGKEYRSYIKVKCAKSHVWEARIRTLLTTGGWCPTCKIDDLPSVILVRKVITEREGTELDTFLAKGPDGKNCRHYKIRCKNGHEWVKRTNQLRRNAQWCDVCEKKKPTILERAYEFIKKNGGKVVGEPVMERISTNISDKTWWINIVCSDGHKSKVTANSLSKGTWCQQCPRKHTSCLTPEFLSRKFVELKKVVEDRGGNLISTEYTGCNDKVLLKCRYEHEFQMSPKSIIRGYWCSACSSNTVREEMVRSIFVEAFRGKLFPNTHTAPFMKGLEIDGYNAELKLAWEHNGQQHYKWVKIFQPTESHFHRQVELDRIRKERCDEAGVKLIIVKYDIKIKDLRQHVRKLITDAGYTNLAPSMGTDEDFFNTSIKHKTNRTDKYYNDLIDIVEGQGKGKIITKAYVSCGILMEFECNEGHTFKMLPKFIKEGKFCRECKKIEHKKTKNSDTVDTRRILTDETKIQECRKYAEFFKWIYVNAYTRYYPSGSNTIDVCYRKCDNTRHPTYTIGRFALRALYKTGNPRKTGTVHNTDPCSFCKKKK